MSAISENKGISKQRIVHVDMDAFFAAIEELENPDLIGKPVVIGSDPKGGRGRGVVSTCNYEARKFGIHSAQPISKAYSLCSKAIFLRPRMKKYSHYSAMFKSVLNNFSPLIENVGIDEAYLDCTGTERLFGNAYELGQCIKDKINSNTGLTASIGIASNKYVAKISSDLDKPDGLTICIPGQEKAFLSNLPINRLWGAGKSIISKMRTLNIKKIGDLANSDINTIHSVLGNRGRALWKLANGIDERQFKSNQTRKSISEEHTFEQDVDDDEILFSTINVISENLGHKIRNENFKFRTLQLKIRLTGFATYTRSITIPEYTNLTKTIRYQALKLFKNFERKDKVRLIGISLQQLFKCNQTNTQLSLFSESLFDNKFEKDTSRDAVFDSLKNKFNQQLSTAATMNNSSF